MYRYVSICITEIKFRLINFWKSVYLLLYWGNCRSLQWPRGLRHRSSAVRLLRLWVRISPVAWMFVYCVLSGRGLCDGLITYPAKSYRLWRVVVCDQETSKTMRLKPATGLWEIQPQWFVTPGKQTNNILSELLIKRKFHTTVSQFPVPNCAILCHIVQYCVSQREVALWLWELVKCKGFAVTTRLVTLELL
jgi:hypothetical protein